MNKHDADAKAMGFNSSEEVLEWQQRQEEKPKRMYPDIVYALADSVDYYKGATKAQTLILLYTAYLEGRNSVIEKEYRKNRFT